MAAAQFVDFAPAHLRTADPQHDAGDLVVLGGLVHPVDHVAQVGLDRRTAARRRALGKVLFERE